VAHLSLFSLSCPNPNLEYALAFSLLSFSCPVDLFLLVLFSFFAPPSRPSPPCHSYVLRKVPFFQSRLKFCSRFFLSCLTRCISFLISFFPPPTAPSLDRLFIFFLAGVCSFAFFPPVLRSVPIRSRRPFSRVLLPLDFFLPVRPPLQISVFAFCSSSPPVGLPPTPPFFFFFPAHNPSHSKGWAIVFSFSSSLFE